MSCSLLSFLSSNIPLFRTMGASINNVISRWREGVVVNPIDDLEHHYSWSQNGCPKILENSNFPLLKICVKIISLPKKQPQRECWRRTIIWSAVFLNIFWKTNYFNTDLKKREIWIFQIWGAQVSDQLTQYRTSTLVHKPNVIKIPLAGEKGG